MASGDSDGREGRQRTFEFFYSGHCTLLDLPVLSEPPSWSLYESSTVYFVVYSRVHGENPLYKSRACLSELVRDD